MFFQRQVFPTVSFEAKNKNGALCISWSTSLTRIQRIQILGAIFFFFENLFEIRDCYSLKDVVISVVVKKNIALDELSRLTEQDVSSVPPHMTLTLSGAWRAWYLEDM